MQKLNLYLNQCNHENCNCREENIILKNITLDKTNIKLPIPIVNVNEIIDIIYNDANNITTPIVNGKPKKKHPWKYTLKEFIIRAREIHRDKYNYDKVEYTNCDTKVCIICNECGCEFFQSPYNHINLQCGCKRCINMEKLTTEIFIERSNKIHNYTFDYSKTNYINNDTKVCVICKICGLEYFVNAKTHMLTNTNCPRCAAIHKTHTITKFIEAANKIHNNFYIYTKSIYIGCGIKICITCPIHGDFWQTPNKHLLGRGCKLCNSSKGEREILKFLKNNNMSFEIEKKFKNCINPETHRKLKFDFYLSDRNILIEFDGKQHFEKIQLGNHKMTDEELKGNQYRDAIKTKYATDNNIKLIRIPYTEFNNINKILTTELHLT